MNTISKISEECLSGKEGGSEGGKDVGGKKGGRDGGREGGRDGERGEEERGMLKSKTFSIIVDTRTNQLIRFLKIFNKNQT